MKNDVFGPDANNIGKSFIEFKVFIKRKLKFNYSFELKWSDLEIIKKKKSIWENTTCSYKWLNQLIDILDK